MWDQQRVLFEEHGSQIYKRDKDFLLMEIINLEDKDPPYKTSDDTWQVIQVQEVV